MPVAPDPYVPGHGDIRYAVDHYDLTLDYRVSTNRLDGRATLAVRALVATDTIRLDLVGLHIDKLRVDGRRPAKVAQKPRGVEVKFDKPLARGQVAQVEISYSGKPAPVRGPHGPAGWEELTDGVLVASQPYGAPSWYPCNDRADDKGSYRISITTDVGYLALANGTLVEQTRTSGRPTLVYDEPAPTSPYLVCLNIGRLRLTTVGDRVDVVHPVARPLPSVSPMTRLPAMLATLELWFGPYPFDRFTAVVVDDPLEIPLEAQGMASFGLNHLTPEWDNERLIVHELAHQWFGNAVTARLMRDIWLHEGFACYTEWLWSEHRGLGSADERARAHWAGLRSSGQRTPLSDPGAANMFDDWVYKRGALTLHALRLAVGDGTFFAILKWWVADHAGGVVSTADFIALVRRQTDVDVASLFAAWLDQVALPAFPARGAGGSSSTQKTAR